MRTPSDLAAKLRSVLTQEQRGLQSLSEEIAHTRPGGGLGWTRKQELGHLLDSAANNRVRFLAACTDGHFVGRTYAQDQWVDLGGYQDLLWENLVSYWLATNELMAVAIERLSHGALASLCTIGNNAPVTLEFLIVDYILHMQHHLDHLLDRAEITPYPGTSVIGH